jgi:hypothetical protein
MDLQHVIVKIPLDGELAVEPGEFIDIFHRWVAAQSLPELLVDVTDLRHVPAGPGVVLVGYQADYGIDHTGNRWGLLYRRKDVVPGTNQERLTQAYRAALDACSKLEGELPGRIRFSRSTVEVIINDRALAPNTPDTRAAAAPDFEAFGQSVFGTAAVTLTPHDGDPRRRFGMTVSVA